MALNALKNRDLDMPTKYQEYINNAACTDRQGSPAFLPRDATLARHMLSSHVRLSVRLSEAGIVSKQLGKLSCFFGMAASFHISHTVIRKYG